MIRIGYIENISETGKHGINFTVIDNNLDLFFVDELKYDAEVTINEDDVKKLKNYLTECQKRDANEQIYIHVIKGIEDDEDEIEIKFSYIERRLNIRIGGEIDDDYFYLNFKYEYINKIVAYLDLALNAISNFKK